MYSHLFNALCAFIFTFGFVTSAQGSLIDHGNGMIYDDDIDLTMLQDMNYAMTSGYHPDGQLTWQEAVNWADQLNFGGFDDWRLPSVAPCFDFDELCPGLGELGHIYFDELGGTEVGPGWIPPDLSIFDNAMGGRYWAGPGDSTHAWWYSLTNGTQDLWPIDGNTEYVWAVRDGNPVPVPGAIWLFVSGLLGMMGMAAGLRVQSDEVDG